MEAELAPKRMDEYRTRNEQDARKGAIIRHPFLLYFCQCWFWVPGFVDGALRPARASRDGTCPRKPPAQKVLS